MIVEGSPAPARAVQASSPAALPATSTPHEDERTGGALSSSSSSDSDDDGSSSSSDEGEDEDDVRLVKTTAAPTTAPPATNGGPNAARSAPLFSVLLFSAPLFSFGVHSWPIVHIFLLPFLSPCLNINLKFRLKPLSILLLAEQLKRLRLGGLTSRLTAPWYALTGVMIARGL